jgi:hypothetical protein
VVLGTTFHVLAPGDCLRYGPPADVTFCNRGLARCRYVIALLRVAEKHGSRQIGNPGVLR